MRKETKALLQENNQQETPVSYTHLNEESHNDGIIQSKKAENHNKKSVKNKEEINKKNTDSLKKNKLNKRGKKDTLKKIALAIVIFAASGAVILASPVFAVNNIEVNELKYFTKDEICTKIGLSQGDNGAVSYTHLTPFSIQLY